jgi:aryl-phospho-beta-D-glucosidase BglC (GH1 family)
VVAVLVIVVVALFGALITSCGRAGATDDERALVEARMQTLRRGVNLSHWFAQAPVSPARLQTTIVADDVQRIRRMGFDHVRLPVDPEILAPGGTFDAPDEDVLYYLEDGVRLLLDGGLAVIVDLHPEEAFKRRLETEPAVLDQTARLWSLLARRLASYDPDRLFLEAMNEPGFPDPGRWAATQRRLVAGIREGAPAHTIIATGHGWSGVEHLEALEPLADPNIVYSFHFYDPHVFTHQGATWDRAAVVALRDVPYPSTPALVAPLLGRVADPESRAALLKYGEQRWDAQTIDAAIARAESWMRRYRVRVLCDEFGVYRPAAPQDDRARWLRDVRTSLEARGIGWTAWDYAGGFGVVDRMPTGSVIHAPTARALFGP